MTLSPSDELELRRRIHDLEAALGRATRTQALIDRARAYELVEQELRTFKPLIDVSVRSDHITLRSIGMATAASLLDAVDELRRQT